MTGAVKQKVEESPLLDLEALSPQERSLCFFNQLSPNALAYHIVRAITLKGDVSPEAMKVAFEALLERHEALRTCYPCNDGVHRRAVMSKDCAALVVVDQAEASQDMFDTTVMSHRNQVQSKPFDLMSGPLIRAVLVLGPYDKHVLMLAMHHIVSDSWSLKTLYSDLVALYDSAVAKTINPLKPYRCYSEFAAVENARWSKGCSSTALNYWKDRLKNAPVLDMPTDRPFSENRNHRGTRISKSVSNTLFAQLQKIEEAEKATCFMSLLTVYGMLLARYSQQDDVVIGSPAANRVDPEFEETIGLFVNMLALRLELNDDLTFRKVLGQTRARCLEAYDRQEVPFEKIVETLAPERVAGRQPVFQAVFVFHDSPLPESVGASVIWQPKRVNTETSKYDLSLHVNPTVDGIDFALEYDTDLFQPETASAILESYITLLKDVTARPDVSIAALMLVEKSKIAKLRALGRGAIRPYPGQLTLPKLIADRAKREPDAPAICWPNGVASLGDLNAVTDKLAGQLMKVRCAEKSIIGVHAERGPARIIGALAAMKAGCAYLPLDPNYPPAYQKTIIEDARPSIILVSGTSGEEITHLYSFGAEIITIPMLGAVFDDPYEFEAPVIDSDDGAYIIYTSGSTGKPNGISVSHRAICNRLFWGQETYPLNKADRILQITSFGFDFSVWELFAPLAFGGCVVFPPSRLEHDVDGLISFVRDEKISAARLAPSLLALAVESEEFSTATSLKRLFSGGEELPQSTMERILARRPDLELFNQYGPAEAAINVAAWRCHKEDTGSRVPIGFPIANCNVDVLDANGAPVPDGAIGEIHIGGVNLADGYISRPELDQERFIADSGPGSISGSRLYKSGDLARRRPGGAIEFIGRKDNQINLRGFRIELGEIDAALTRCQGVRQACAGTRRDGVGYEMLAALVVWERGVEHDIDTVRSELRRELPDHMVPSAYISADHIPQTPSGKIDRKSVQAALRASQSTLNWMSEPQNEPERIIAEIWAQALDIKSIDINANFFDIGGHSLMFAAVCQRLQKRIGSHISILDLFRYPTVSALAQYLSSLALDETGPEQSDKQKPRRSNRAAQYATRVRHRTIKRS